MKPGENFTFKLLDTFSEDGRRQAEITITNENDPNGKSIHIGNCTISDTRIIVDVPDIDERLMLEFSPIDLYNLSKDDANA